MPRTGILIGGFVVILIAIVMVLVSTRGTDEWRDEASRQAEPTKVDRSGSEPAPDDPTSTNRERVPPADSSQRGDAIAKPAAPRNREEAEAFFAIAQAEHDAALAALATAEYALDDLEREVDAVERFVEDLRERGEDPARHAEEGMRRLDPVITRYEERLAAVEQADAREAAARARLEAAREARDLFRRSTP